MYRLGRIGLEETIMILTWTTSPSVHLFTGAILHRTLFESDMSRVCQLASALGIAVELIVQVPDTSMPGAAFMLLLNTEEHGSEPDIHKKRASL